MDDVLKIYRLKHRNGRINDIITPSHVVDLQVGSALSNEDVCELKDNTGDNISHLNQIYLETTGHYWVWKNAEKTKYVGFEHYRRHIKLEREAILYFMQNADIITLKPVNVSSVELHYEYCHSKTDLKVIKQIVIDLYPEYAESWDKHITNGKIVLPCNSFITSWTIFDDMWSFIQNILNEFKKRLKLNNIEDFKNHIINTANKISDPGHAKSGLGWVDYQMRIFGALSERLMTLYVLHNFPLERIGFAEYKETDELPAI